MTIQTELASSHSLAQDGSRKLAVQWRGLLGLDSSPRGDLLWAATGGDARGDLAGFARSSRMFRPAARLAFSLPALRLSLSLSLSLTHPLSLLLLKKEELGGGVPQRGGSPVFP